MQVVRKVWILVAGWLLVVAGVAALVLPGPGLLLLLAGMLVLAQEYEWARRRVDPVKVRALDAARQGVQTWPRILVSVAGAGLVMGAGLFWGLDPRIGRWGPVGPHLPLGGWGTGISLIISGLIALALVVVSVQRFRR